MFRRLRRPANMRIVAMLGVLVACGGVGEAATADEVARFLERHGLIEVMTVHLEERLDTTHGDERDQIAVRLASLYASLLETTDDPARRVAIEQRSRELLANDAGQGSYDLRLALLRAQYRLAERVAEQHRLRLSSDEDLDTARNTLSDLIPRLRALYQTLDERIGNLDRRLANASGTLAVRLTEEVESLHMLRVQTNFLMGWSLYYQAWMLDRAEVARAGQDIFGELLGLRSAMARPDEVSLDRRKHEAYARSVLGMALCRSITGSAGSAVRWIELLEHPDSYAGLKSQVPVWKFIVHLEGGEYTQVHEQLDRMENAGTEIPVQWLRLVGVSALEGAPRSRQASELARHAVTRLAVRGELSQVLDLAGRYGMDALGEAGFALRYVSGVLAYHDARAEHGDEFPTPREGIRSRYRAAIDDLAAAIKESDASTYPTAMVDAWRLIGWSRFFRSEFLDARDAFFSAEGLASAAEAPDLLWMAIVSMDKVAKEDDRLEDQLTSLIDRFLSQYPHSEHAPKLLFRRAVATEEMTLEVAEQLLGIPESNEVYLAARRRAAEILYHLVREAESDEKVSLASRFLDVAMPLFLDAADRITAVDTLTMNRVVVEGRRILEIALHEDVERPGPARTVLDRFDEMTSTRAVDLSTIADELDYRRVCERLLFDDVTPAETMADTMWMRDDSTIWARLSARALFRYGSTIWESGGSPVVDVRTAQNLVARHGQRIIEEYGPTVETLRQPSVLSYSARTAEALQVIYDRSENPETGQAALDLYQVLLDAQPSNRVFLRATAMLGLALDEIDLSLRCWRALLSGTPGQSDAWFEAKYHVLLILADTDATRAREVMNQHRLLNPTYGPAPWGTRLRMLDERIPGGGG